MNRIITQLYRCVKYVNDSKLKYDLTFPEITNNITYDSNLSKYKTIPKHNRNGVLYIRSNIIAGKNLSFLYLK